MSALASVKVVSLEQAVAAPLCTRRLAQAGAEVFKIERPEGDFARFYDTAVAGESAYFVWLNAGKKSVVLDLREADEVACLLELISRADVLVQNLKPGALAKLGVDLDTLRAQRPTLITVSIAGFHPSGPGAERKAYDLLMQAESGLAEITGSPHAPGRVGVSLVDLATGMFAYEAVLEALLERASTGRGKHIDVALFDSVAEWLAVPYLLDRYGGAAPQRVGLAHPGICPYGVFTSADGQPFVLSIQNEREWARLCEIGLDDPELLDDPRCASNETRVANRPFVDDRIQAALGARAYAEIRERLDRADLAFAPVNPIESLKGHPDFRTVPIDVNGRAVDLPSVPGSVIEAGAVVPKLGEHTAAVKAWLNA
jgi:crotonobetainyl-CoA:carnitine CoA-transferase CaiB-like acyl-CoA transferase